MVKRVQKLLALVAIVILALGNALNLAAGASEHSNAFVHDSAMGTGHTHQPGHAAHLALTIDARDVCAAGGDCSPVDHSTQPCCHVDAHCCSATGFVPEQSKLPLPAIVSGRYAPAASALPLGSLHYPLLRPPLRQAV